MATKLESDYPSSPPNDESDNEEQEDSNDDSNVKEEPNLGHETTIVSKKQAPAEPTNNNVQDILKRLQSSGALLKKPKQEYHCQTCNEEFPNWPELESHLLQHVSLPSVVIDKLPSEDEDIPQSGDEEWSDEEENPPPPKNVPKAPQKVDISQLLKNTGLSLKKPNEASKNSDAALDKLSGLGFTIKKNFSPIKKETDIKTEPADKQDVMQKLGKLGGIKLKLKSDGNNSNSFKVINGLKDFKTSDDEEYDEEESENKKDDDQEDNFSDEDKLEEHEDPEENDSAEEEDVKPEHKMLNTTQSVKVANTLKNLQGKTVISKPLAKPPVPEMKRIPQKPAAVLRTPSKDTPLKEGIAAKPLGRPNMKQTPKRGANLPLTSQEFPKIKEITETDSPSSNSTPERRTSHDMSAENVTVKQEVDSGEPQSDTNAPLFSGPVKTERSSPPPPQTEEKLSPIISSVKSEPEPVSTSHAVPLFANQPQQSTAAPPVQAANTVGTTPLLPVTKTEQAVTIIEINGDSGDDDDDCCVVDSTPATDVKPVIPKTEPTQTYPPPAFSATSQPSYGAVPIARTSTVSSLEKQHNFNWNAPDSKPAIDMLEKSADDMFESLLSSATKKENLSLSDASEYISLDTLGPQHSCDVCNTRFTDISLLDDHRRMTGHGRSLVPSSSSTLLPYNPSSSSILQSLLPVKQMVEQVGKLSGIGSGPGFTHQQNVMINIQAYPGAGGMMQTPQSPYNTYPSSQNMQPGYGQAPGNMFNTQGQPMQNQYPNQTYMGQQPYGSQFQSPMDKPAYPGTMPPTTFDSSPYSTASPLQSMQQAVYGQPATSMSSGLGQMGPPPAPGSQYASTNSPGSMKPPVSGSGVRIQNIQTFPPGQMIGMPGQPGVDGQMGMQPGLQATAPGQVIGGQQMPSPGQIRMAAGANVTGSRPRMPNVRGQRPTIRPGIQVHGQIRGSKPVRMPIKRPGQGPGGPVMKKRPGMLLPGKHDNEDCQVMAMQKQREGMPLIQSVQGAKDKLNLGSQISITKKAPVNKEASAMANVLASRGISVKQKQKSRSPSPDRPLPHIPNLGAGMSIKHTSKASSFSIPEAKVGGNMLSCKICKKMFMSQNSLNVHMSNAHPDSKLPLFKCEECPASYPKILQLQHHKRVFHNVVGSNRELGLPVVDMSQEDNLKRLSSLGIYSYIPLAGRDQGGGCFGIPVISVHNAQNGMTSSLQALGADGMLSLGPLKSLPNT